MDKAVGYVRVSTEEQAKEGTGIETQKDRVYYFCKGKGWEITEWYIDAAHSGSNLERPEIKRLINDVKEGKVDIVVIYKLDRLSRNLVHLRYVYNDVFKENNVDLVSTCESIDTTTPSGRMAFNILGSFAEFERDMITSRMNDARLLKAKNGGHAGGAIPYGFKKDEKGNIVSDEIQVEVVRSMFKFREAGRTLREIKDILNFVADLNEGDNRYLSKGGRKWTEGKIHYILNNDKYKGIMRQIVGGEIIESYSDDFNILKDL